uniref:Chromoprotein n=1 Tax=Acropora tenuis TaxID=70783 RepID=A0A7U3V466_ACRTE|nr:chromoprotein [Acropora tenuis]
MTYKVFMSGTVNGHYFEVEGDGKGKPYEAKKPVKMPGYHYVDRKLDVTNHNKDYTSVEQCEISIARKPVVA